MLHLPGLVLAALSVAVEQIFCTVFVTPLRVVLNIVKMYINSLILVIKPLEH